MPAAAWAAKAGDPVLWSDRDRIPAATKAAITAHRRPRIYVLGPSSVISDKVLKDLGELGTTRRISGPEPVANAIAFARFTDGKFGWNAVDPGHGLVFATHAAPRRRRRLRRPLRRRHLRAAAARHRGQRAPVPRCRTTCSTSSPATTTTPCAASTTTAGSIGDEQAISIDVQSRIDALLEIQPVQPGS